MPLPTSCDNKWSDRIKISFSLQYKKPTNCLKKFSACCSLSRRSSSFFREYAANSSLLTIPSPGSQNSWELRDLNVGECRQQSEWFPRKLVKPKVLKKNIRFRMKIAKKLFAQQQLFSSKIRSLLKTHSRFFSKYKETNFLITIQVLFVIQPWFVLNVRPIG